jgi:hypothetical protein
MTILLRWLAIPIIALIVLLFWKGSSLVIKLALLIVPLIGLVAWFAHEGAFDRRMGLADIYAASSIAAFLLCYETGMLIHRWVLVHKGMSTHEDNIFLIVGLVLLLTAFIYFLISIS